MVFVLYCVVLPFFAIHNSLDCKTKALHSRLYLPLPQYLQLRFDGERNSESVDQVPIDVIQKFAFFPVGVVWPAGTLPCPIGELRFGQQVVNANANANGCGFVCVVVAVAVAIRCDLFVFVFFSLALFLGLSCQQEPIGLVDQKFDRVPKGRFVRPGRQRTQDSVFLDCSQPQLLLLLLLLLLFA